MNAHNTNNTQLDLKGLPAAHDAEKALLGAILLENERLAEAAASLSPEDFFLPSHQTIFRAMTALADKEMVIEPLALAEELRAAGDLDRIGGPAFIATLWDGVWKYQSGFENYLRLINEAATKRRLIKAAAAVQAAAFDGEMGGGEALAEAHRLLQGIEDPNAKGQEWADAGTVSLIVLDQTEERAASGRGYAGLVTGLPDLDAQMGGLQKSSYIVIGGRPSMGKSALAGEIALGVSKHPANLTPDGQKPVVAVFSVEMAREIYIQRMQCSIAGVDLHRMQTGRLQDNEWKRLAQAAQELSEQRIFINDTAPLSPSQARGLTRKLVNKYGRIDLIILDFLQLMKGDVDTDSKEREVTDISHGLKAIAKEFGVPLIALASLNRSCESRTDKRPLLSDLRDSGSVESDADIVAFVYREAVYNESCPVPSEAEIIFRKHRNGPIGTVLLRFEKQYTRFRPYGG